MKQLNGMKRLWTEGNNQERNSIISELISKLETSGNRADTSENGITDTEERIFILTVNADENNKKIKL